MAQALSLQRRHSCRRLPPPPSRIKEEGAQKNGDPSDSRQLNEVVSNNNGRRKPLARTCKKNRRQPKRPFLNPCSSVMPRPRLTVPSIVSDLPVPVSPARALPRSRKRPTASYPEVARASRRAASASGPTSIADLLLRLFSLRSIPRRAVPDPDGVRAPSYTLFSRRQTCTTGC